MPCATIVERCTCYATIIVTQACYDIKKHGHVDNIYVQRRSNPSIFKGHVDGVSNIFTICDDK